MNGQLEENNDFEKMEDWWKLADKLGLKNLKLTCLNLQRFGFQHARDGNFEWN